MPFRKYRPRGLQARLVAVFFVVVLMPLIGIGLYGHFFVTNTLKQIVFQRSTQEVHWQAQQIVLTLETAYSNLVAISQLGSLQMLQSVMAESRSDMSVFREAVAQDFAVFSATNPLYYQIALLDSHGDEIVRVDSDGTSPRIAAPEELGSRQEEPYFQAVLALAPGGIHASSMSTITHGAAEIPVMYYALKMAQHNNVLILGLYGSRIFKDLMADREGSNTWLMADQNGRFLLYDTSDPQSGDRDSQRQWANLAVRYPGANTLLSGGFGVVETEKRVIAYNTIYPVAAEPTLFWVVLRDTPKNIIFADIAAFHRTATFFYAGTLVTALALALLASEHIVTPLRALQQAVEAFGRGNPPPVIPDRLPSDEVGALTRAFGVMADELEKKRQQQRDLIERLITVQEEERKLVAYDLHDGLMQQLVGVRFHLLNCRRSGQGEHIGDMDSLKRSSDVLTDAIVEGRRIIQGLHPTVLDDLGLIAALKELAETTAAAANWTLELDLETLPAEPERSLSVTIYRIAQEAINNARKHACATHLSLSLHNHNGLRLLVRDNGQGFDPASITVNKRGFGLTTMRERANLLDGRCQIDSRVGLGTTIQIWLPWKEEEFAL